MRGQRPLGVAALEDKILQRAVAEVLNVVYEVDFLGFPYGFRPGRSQHDALDAVAFGTTRLKVNYILDCDIRVFFDSLSHEWLVRFIEHRIGDPRIVRLICKWLKAGVVVDGRREVSDIGSPQGAVLSPTLASNYLHYCFDLWANGGDAVTLTGKSFSRAMPMTLLSALSGKMMRSAFCRQCVRAWESSH